MAMSKWADKGSSGQAGRLEKRMQWGPGTYRGELLVDSSQQCKMGRNS